MTDLPDGYTVSVTYDERSRPVYAELRDSARGEMLGDAIWHRDRNEWGNPTDIARTPQDQSVLAAATDAGWADPPKTLIAWLAERNLRGDEAAW